MKKLLNIVIFLILGIVVGFGGTYYWANNTFTWLHKFKVAEDLEEAHYLYKNAEPSIAIYKLERTLSQIKSYEDAGVNINFNERGANWDKGLIHGRIGRLYKKLGNTENASIHLNKSIQYYANTGWIIKDEDQMIQAIDMIDKNKLSEAIKNIGELRETNK